jgi:hypothetical protein
MRQCAAGVVQWAHDSHRVKSGYLGWGMGEGGSPDVPADPPSNAEEGVEKDDKADAAGNHVMPRRLGGEGDSVDQRQWDHDDPGHEAPHLYDGLMARLAS